MTTWKRFMKLDDEDIDELSKQARNNVRAPIATKFKKELMSFQRMITERKENKEPGARKISSYDADEIIEYYEDYSKKLQANAISHLVLPASAMAPVTIRPVKSKWEKSLNNWTREKHNKAQFPVLHNNSEFITWNEKFIAKYNVQKLSNIVNPDYKLDYIDPFEQELFDDQCTYFWSVLLRSLQNSYGQDCLSERMEDHDAILA